MTDGPDAKRAKQEAEWKLLHDEACKKGEFTYIDPSTGYMVYTRLKHLDRGHCCDSGCRHCPYKETRD